jgi:CxxC motif-containing protein (DUF1111 family)
VGRFFIVCLLLASCGDDGGDEPERFQGGTQSVDDRTATAYSHPLPDLEPAQAETHSFGMGRFGFLWQPPILGPLFNHNACLACHAGHGRGLSQIGPSTFGSQALVRISTLAGEPPVPGGNIPVEGLGLQLQDHHTGGVPEGRVELTWIESEVTYGDGEIQPMREPRVNVTNGAGGLLPAGTLFSYRQAQVVFGLGLLEAVPDAALTALADEADADGDGLSGRINSVWDPRAGATRVGRFGHKATQPSLLEQVAAAYVDDIGLTNRLHPEPDGFADISSAILDDTTFFIATLAVPMAAPRDPEIERGRVLFDDFQCAGCHTPTLETGDHPIPQLAGQTIHPYTDLLLHDVGDRLTDARPDVMATGEEWRTAPLWGIGLTQLVAPDATFLHDGRARTLAEAILWHGGEATPSAESFRLANRADRDALIAFLMSL